MAKAAKKWGDIKRQRFSEADIAAMREEVAREVLEMNLAAVRGLIGKNQTEVAEAMKIRQGNLSDFERRDDHLVSTLRGYVEALGGELVVTAVFDDKTVRLKGV